MQRALEIWPVRESLTEFGGLLCLWALWTEWRLTPWVPVLLSDFPFLCLSLLICKLVRDIIYTLSGLCKN